MSHYGAALFISGFEFAARVRRVPVDGGIHALAPGPAETDIGLPAGTS
jgi:hypothetical protein